VFVNYDQMIYTFKKDLLIKNYNNPIGILLGNINFSTMINQPFMKTLILLKTKSRVLFVWAIYAYQ